MGYGYVAFGDFHFKDDLQMEDAIPMLRRLVDMAEELGLQFGVKLTNTFPVDVDENQLPSQEMYMSGKPLSILSLSVALKLSEAFKGRLRISYSGGADYFNIERIFNTGIWPVTMATYFLKPGGYKRAKQIAELLDRQEYTGFEKVDVEKLRSLIEDMADDKHYHKSTGGRSSRKLEDKVPLWDCFTSPCSEQCPINQDIPAYVRLTGEGKYLEALKVITSKNPLPFTTGTICSHTCMSKCMRNFYEGPVSIRDVKLVAAEKGYQELLGELKPLSDSLKNRKVAVVGGGPGGIASAFFLAREGASVTVFEKKDRIGGIITNVVPEFRIPSERVEKDIELARRLGVKFVTGREIKSLEELREQGFQNIILAVGAYKPKALGIPCERQMNAIDFLESCRKSAECINPGKAVAVIGAGNTAMDAARAALRLEGVERAYIVYRRTRRYMPADDDELMLALEEGVIFKELLSPIAHKDGKLICRRMELGEPDSSGRRSPIATENLEELPVDLIVASLGEKPDGTFYSTLGITVDNNGCPVLKPDTMESSVNGVYVVGDGSRGPATVVEAIRDARKAADDIGCMKNTEPIASDGGFERSIGKRGVIVEATCDEREHMRCFECSSFCGVCTEVCPNRANVLIHAEGFSMPQILHIDYMCNECGNCRSFCPYDSAPYKDKLTLFNTVEDFENSNNQGFVMTDRNLLKFMIRLNGETKELTLNEEDRIAQFISAVIRDYPYLFLK
jgi:putative selenate reductase